MSPFSSLRGRLTAAALLGTAITLAVLTLAFNVLLSSSLSHDVDGRLRSRAEATLATLRVTGSSVAIGEAPDDAVVDSQIWVYARGRSLERPKAPPGLQDAADALAAHATARVTQEVSQYDVRLLAVPVSENGNRLGTIVAGVSTAASERTAQLALFGSLVFAALVLLVVGGLMWLTVRRALQPVARMTEQAAEWSERDLDSRFGAARRPDELGRLAATFDGLLGRLAASLRHEQRMTAELSHELRTPLAKVMLETDMLLRRDREPEQRREALAAIAAGAEHMSRILETLMTAARAESDLQAGRSDARATATRAAETVEEAAAAHGVRVEAPAAGPPILAGVDSDLLERAIMPLLENACRHAQASVRLEVAAHDGRVLVDVADDGPGVDPDERELIFEPGVRGKATAIGHTGAGLGLSLARRLARAAGGEVSALEAQSGARFRVEVPAG